MMICDVMWRREWSVWLPLLVVLTTPALHAGQNTGGRVSKSVEKCLYLQIDLFEIFFHSSGYPDINSTQLDEMDHIEDRLTGYCNDSHQSDSITFTRYYGGSNVSLDHKSFNFTMVFERDPTSTDQEWFMSSFKHRNLSDDGVIFHYSGVEDTISASGDMGYMCNLVKFSGRSGEGDKTSTVTFHNLKVQAFASKQSSTFHNCGMNSKTNFYINLSIGLVVGGTVLIALVVIVIVLVIKRVRRREYDLLDT